MSASVLALGIITVSALGTSAVAGSAALLVERHRLTAAADASALAAADVAAGLVPGEACAVALVVVSATGAHLSGCLIEGTTATVSVASRGSPLPIRAVATAGQPRDDLDEFQARAKK